MAASYIKMTKMDFTIARINKTKKAFKKACKKCKNGLFLIPTL